MEKENKVIILLVLAMSISILLGLFISQTLSEIRTVSAEIRGVSSDVKVLTATIKDVDSSLKDVKTGLAEKETGLFRRNMEENGRRMIVMSYAVRVSKWNIVKKEITEIDKDLESAADLRPDLAPAIQNFRNTYIPKLNETADKKDTKNFNAIWNDAYNACVACHTGITAPPAAFETLREISSEVEELSG